MKCVMIVSTQMQLINCIEVCEHYSLVVYELIVYCRSIEREKQLKLLLKEKRIKMYFSHIIYFTIPSNRFASFIKQYHYKLFIYFHTKAKKYDSCVVGNNFPIQNRYLIYRIKKQNPRAEIYVADDGLATLTTYKLRLREIQGEQNVYSFSSRILKFVYLLSKVNNFFVDSLVYHTNFNLDHNNRDRYVRNKYSFLKSYVFAFQSRFLPYDPEIIFLGQPLVQKKIISRESFNNYIRFVVTSFRCKKIVYYMHPEEELNDDIFEIDVVNMIKVLKEPYSFELFAYTLTYKCKIISFYTSTLISLKSMNISSELFAIYLEEIDTNNSSYFVNVKDAYQYLKKNGINIINMSSR